MGFVVPQMPLKVNIWNNALVSTAPTIITVGNLSPGRRSLFAVPSTTTNALLDATANQGDCMELMLPKGTDIRGPQNNGPTSIVECPKATGRFYYVLWVDDVAKGFANEYRLALLKQCDYLTVATTHFMSAFGTVPPWPVPTP